MKRFIAMLVLAAVSAGYALAMSPTMIPIDLKDKAGSKVACEGVLYNAYDSPACAGSEKGCTVVLADNCKPLEFAQAVSCRTAKPDNAFMEKYNALKLPSYNAVESVVIAELQKQYPSKWVNVQDLVHSAEYKLEFAKQWDARIHVKVEGVLEGCTHCPNCYPASECAVAQCTIGLVPHETK